MKNKVDELEEKNQFSKTSEQPSIKVEKFLKNKVDKLENENQFLKISEQPSIKFELDDSKNLNSEILKLQEEMLEKVTEKTKLKNELDSLKIQLNENMVQKENENSRLKIIISNLEKEMKSVKSKSGAKEKSYQMKLKRKQDSKFPELAKVKKERNSLIKRLRKAQQVFQQQLSNQFKETQEYAGQVLILKNKVDKLEEKIQFLKASEQSSIKVQQDDSI